MTEAPTERSPRERSPSFPFISLKAAISRLQEFEAKFLRQEPTADRAYLAWGMKGDTSQSQQTLSALKAFGLIEYKGAGPKRLVAISDDGRTYLRAQQEAVKKDVLKKVALKPKWIAHFWQIWGTDKVPDEIRLDALVLQHKFNENAAPTFLKVYDDTIAYAGLGSSDKILFGDDSTDEDEQTEETKETVNNPLAHQAGKQPVAAKVAVGKVALMEGERVAFTEEGGPGHYIKLVASGIVDDSMLEALEDYVKRQRKRLKSTPVNDPDEVMQ